tara:strand:+ start:877 stop:2118 length:1242 start_codon:yes stop_codon:yes gene_type:complete
LGKETKISQKRHDEWLKKNIPSMYKEAQSSKIIFKPYNINEVHKQSKKELFSVVSLFAGGGGSSTGYKLSGAKILMVNEFIDEAVNTYSKNYPNTPIDNRDIREITKKGSKGINDWFKSFQINDYDLLDGSPPCATFSQASVKKDKEKTKNVKYSDKKQDNIDLLIFEWVKVALATNPKVCVLENVPEITRSETFKTAINQLRKKYVVNYKILKAVNFGVPQDRKRLICVGVRRDLADILNIDTKGILKLYPTGSSYLNTVEEALQGIEIDEEERDYVLTACRKSSSYEVIKNIPKDPPERWRLSYTHNQFHNMYFNTDRSAWNRPSPTITQQGTQVNVLGGVYHPVENRLFTLSELKRLMSLPDDFQLTGTWNQRAERVGRMVPPLLMHHLSKSIYEKVISKCSKSSFEIDL